MPRQPTLRPVRIKLSELARAIAKGSAVADKWEENGPKPDNGCAYRQWQAELIEILLMRNLFDRMLRGMAVDGHGAATSYWEKPTRYFDRRLPGYILRHWNGPPREGHWYSHSPGCCWDGIRRELYPSLAEDLRNVTLGHEPSERLSAFWKITIVDDRKECDETTTT